MYSRQRSQAKASDRKVTRRNREGGCAMPFDRPAARSTTHNTSTSGFNAIIPNFEAASKELPYTRPHIPFQKHTAREGKNLHGFPSDNSEHRGETGQIDSTISIFMIPQTIARRLDTGLLRLRFLPCVKAFALLRSRPKRSSFLTS